MKGTGTATPFPTDVPPWAGVEVWTLFGQRQDRKRHLLVRSVDSGEWGMGAASGPSAAGWELGH